MIGKARILKFLLGGVLAVGLAIPGASVAQAEEEVPTSFWKVVGVTEQGEAICKREPCHFPSWCCELV